MTKKKQKTVGYNRPVTEEGGGYEWETGKIRWRYRPSEPGLNLTMIVFGSEIPCVFAKTLAEAGIFAEGCELGMSCQAR